MLAAFREFTAAMIAGDTTRLRDLVADGYTLTHMTGYRQPFEEWLTEMAAGEFRYYSVVESDVSVDIDVSVAISDGGLPDGHATLDAHTITDARVYGSRNTWRLRLVTTYERHDNLRHGPTWLATRTIASTW